MSDFSSLTVFFFNPKSSLKCLFLKFVCKLMWWTEVTGFWLWTLRSAARSCHHRKMLFQRPLHPAKQQAPGGGGGCRQTAPFNLQTATGHTEVISPKTETKVPTFSQHWHSRFSVFFFFFNQELFRICKGCQKHKIKPHSLRLVSFFWLNQAHLSVQIPQWVQTHNDD